MMKIIDMLSKDQVDIAKMQPALFVTFYELIVTYM